MHLSYGSGGGWTPGSLEAPVILEAIKLTSGSAYGGCGAKLAKGLLHTVLCGLPRVSSEALIVGIESADDAGVVHAERHRTGAGAESGDGPTNT